MATARVSGYMIVGLVANCMDGWMDGWMDGRMYVAIYIYGHKYIYIYNKDILQV